MKQNKKLCQPFVSTTQMYKMENRILNYNRMVFRSIFRTKSQQRVVAIYSKWLLHKSQWKHTDSLKNA